MTPKDFADCIRREVIRDNLGYYNDLLARPPDRIRPGGVWQKIVKAFGTMNDEQQEALLTLTQQAMVDTASNILGILDGSSILQDYREEFLLRYGESPDRLNGALQDHFLAGMEDGPQ
jgi:hypothetical protein